MCLVLHPLTTLRAQPHGLSNGSDAPNPLPDFVAAGVAADVHPPKSSSAATVGCVVDLCADRGAPQPPDTSFGVIRAGTLPSSTFGAAGFAGSGAPQAFVSAPPQGSNMAVLDWEVTGGGFGWEAGAGAGFGAVMVGDDRLNAELKTGGLCIAGGWTLAAGAGGGFEGADEKSLKPSSANRSVGIDVD